MFFFMHGEMKYGDKEITACLLVSGEVWRYQAQMR